MPKYLHIVFAPNVTLPQACVAGYFNPELAHAHARTMLGVEVIACEVRDRLPEVVREDLQAEAEWEEDQTPRVVDVELEAIPDKVDD